ncbi:MAG: MFS transporter [Bacilli bacterium]
MKARLWLLALGTFALGTDLFVIAGVLPSIAANLRISVTAAGWLLTAFAITYAVGSPILAASTGRMPRKTVLLAALAVFTIANAAAAAAPDYAVLLIARILAALAAALYTPTASAVAALTASPQQRGRALAIVTAGMTVSIVIGVPLGAWISAALSWRFTLALVAGLGALATAGLAVFIPPVSAPPSPSLRERLLPLRRASVISALFVTVVATAGGFTVYTYLAPYLTVVDRLGSSEVGFFLLWYGAFSVLGNLLGGHGADRFGPRRVIRMGLLIVCASLALLNQAAHSLPAATVAIAVWATAGWLFQAPQQQRLISLTQASPTIALSLNGSAIYLGIAIGSAVGGFMLRGGRHVADLGLAGGALVAAALAFDLLVFRRTAVSKRPALCKGTLCE